MNRQIFSLWSFVMVLSTFLGLISGGLLGCWIISGTTPNFIKILWNWQTLIGSIVGVFGTGIVAISTIFVQRFIEEKGRKNRYLIQIQKQILTAINSVREIDRLLNGFRDGPIAELRSQVAEDAKGNSWSTREVYIPQIPIHVIGEEVLRETSDSGYIDTKMMDVVSLSRSFSLMIEHARIQFEQMIKKNADMGARQVNSAKSHNQMFLSNIDGFIKFLNTNIFANNIPGYYRELCAAFIPLQTYIRLGTSGWRNKFGTQILSAEKIEEMDLYFKDEINRMISEAKQESFLKSPLVLVGEDLPQGE